MYGVDVFKATARDIALHYVRDYYLRFRDEDHNALKYTVNIYVVTTNTSVVYFDWDDQTCKSFAYF